MCFTSPGIHTTSWRVRLFMWLLYWCTLSSVCEAVWESVTMIVDTYDCQKPSVRGPRDNSWCWRSSTSLLCMCLWLAFADVALCVSNQVVPWFLLLVRCSVLLKMRRYLYFYRLLQVITCYKSFLRLKDVYDVLEMKWCFFSRCYVEHTQPPSPAMWTHWHWAGK